MGQAFLTYSSLASSVNSSATDGILERIGVLEGLEITTLIGLLTIEISSEDDQLNMKESPEMGAELRGADSP